MDWSILEKLPPDKNACMEKQGNLDPLRDTNDGERFSVGAIIMFGSPVSEYCEPDVSFLGFHSKNQATWKLNSS